MCGGEERDLNDIVFFSVSAQRGEISDLILLEPGKIKPNLKGEIMLFLVALFKLRFVQLEGCDFYCFVKLLVD